MCPLRWLLGDLVPSSQRGSFLLTHKLPLMKVPSSPYAVFTLVGYLAGCSEGEEDGVLGKTLQSVLGVWSDASALRHMDLRQHLWLSRVTVLGVACLSARQRARLKPGERGSVCLLTEALFVDACVGVCSLKRFSLCSPSSLSPAAAGDGWATGSLRLTTPRT